MVPKICGNLSVVKSSVRIDRKFFDMVELDMRSLGIGTLFYLN